MVSIKEQNPPPQIFRIKMMTSDTLYRVEMINIMTKLAVRPTGLTEVLRELGSIHQTDD